MNTPESIMRTVVAADVESSPPNTKGFTHIAADGMPRVLGKGRIRLVLTLMLLGLLVGSGVWAVKWLLATQQFAVTRVRIEGEIHHTTPTVIQATLAKQLSENFFALDIDSVRHALELLPWVAEVRVRRVWPLTLVIWVSEREALARWGDRSLVSPDGFVFTPETQSIPTDLNYLHGPNGSVLQVIDRYRWLQKRLAISGFEVTKLVLSDRHAWYLDLKNGLKLSIGTKDLELRIERFLRYLPKLPQPEALEQVDLRYVNGFAVRWRATLPTATTH